MAILSVDDVASGFASSPGPVRFRKTGVTMEEQGILHSTWYEAGIPGAGSAPSPGIDGAALTSDPTMVTGQVPFVKAATGANKHLGLIKGRASTSGTLYLMDRIWHNSGISITTTTAQAISFSAYGNRDVDGAALGNGVLAAIEVSSATGGGSPITNTTISYTNEAGTSGRTGTLPSFPATAIAGTFCEFYLAAGDKGIRSIQSITLGTSYTSGTIHLILYRILASLQFSAALARDLQTWDQLGLPRLYDGTVPWFVWEADSIGAANFDGHLAYAEK